MHYLTAATSPATPSILLPPSPPPALRRRAPGGAAGAPAQSSSSSPSASPAPTQPSGPSTAVGRLKYYGGPVLASVEVTMLLWGAASEIPFASELEGFYSAVVNSTYFDLLSQYSTPTQALGRGSFLRTLALPDAPTPAAGVALDDAADIRPYLLGLVKDGTIHPTADSYYAIHFPPGQEVKLEGARSCVDFCAYHYTLDLSSVVATNGTTTAATHDDAAALLPLQPFLAYGVLPDLTAPGCATGCGGGSTGSTSPSSAFGAACSVASHELAEAATDPAVGLLPPDAPGIAAPVAWYADPDGEVGDLCNGIDHALAPGSPYVVQAMWSNRDAACV
ncbi:hypothetical protein HK405_009640 [Cladochytrium tenue]|nr:hypothetical protein HK405_009640 [Cladochytrium tenue]